jgi:hypothetical protein
VVVGRVSDGDGHVVVDGLGGGTTRDELGLGVGEGLDVVGGFDTGGRADRVGLGGDVPPRTGVSKKLPSQ